MRKRAKRSPLKEVTNQQRGAWPWWASATGLETASNVFAVDRPNKLIHNKFNKSLIGPTLNYINEIIAKFTVFNLSNFWINISRHYTPRQHCRFLTMYRHFYYHKMIAEKKIQSKNKENTTKLNTVKQFTKDMSHEWYFASNFVRCCSRTMHGSSNWNSVTTVINSVNTACMTQ